MRNSRLMFIVLMMLGACKQSEFYQKSQDAAGLSVNPVDNTATTTVTAGNGGTVTNNVTTAAVAQPAAVIQQQPAAVIQQPTAAVVQQPTVAVAVDPAPVQAPIIQPAIVYQAPAVQQASASAPAAAATVVAPAQVQAPVQAPAQAVVQAPVVIAQPAIVQKGDLDILLVVDNSMKDNKGIKDNLNKLIKRFKEKGLDFKFSVTTSDASKEHDGRKECDDSKLSSENFKKFDKDDYTSDIKFGKRGSENEKGLRTASQFLNRYKSSFLRKEAHFATIILSERDDESGGDIKNFSEAIRNSKEDKNAKIYAVTKIKSEEMDEKIGKRYMEAARLTGGIASDIKGEWSKEIGDKILEDIDHKNAGLANN